MKCKTFGWLQSQRTGELLIRGWRLGCPEPVLTPLFLRLNLFDHHRRGPAAVVNLAARRNPLSRKRQ